MRARNPGPRFCRLLPVVAALAGTQGPAGAAADLEVRKAVDDAVPDPGEPVAFTIDVRNLGTDVASDVHVRDLLPDGLAIPDGLAAFPASGSYDPVTGDWSVGNLDPAASSRLVIPAIVAAQRPPVCLVNVAESAYAGDSDPANDRAVAAVRRSADARCVDLAAQVTSLQLGSTTCGATNRFDASIEVTNRGPDAAGDVTVDLGQDPLIAPELHFTTQLSGPAASCSRTRCAIESLGAGETVRLMAESGDFRITRATTVTLSVTAASSDDDYLADNDHDERSLAVPGPDGCLVVGGTSDNGACVVVAAIRGSRLERYVVELRGFRDRRLMQSAPGRAAVQSYYRVSPTLARVVTAREWLRSTVRLALAPAVLAIVYPIQALLAVLSGCALLSYALWRRSRRPVTSGRRPASPSDCAS